MGSMIGALRSFGQDSSVLKQKVKKGTARRTLSFAAPYAGLLTVFLVVVIVDAGIGIANPLIYREIINNGILKGNSLLIVQLALLVGVLGLLDGALGMAQTYLSSKIGAEVVLTLRAKLFDHIQRMPLAFFTRTQTGALVSRLNTDVGGARTAFTDILSNVVGNVITVTLILVAMFVLSWPITLAALVLLPLFVLPARFWGRKLQGIARESYDLTAAMNNLMVERFNVAGALLAKLFGHSREELKSFESKAARVSDITVKQAMYGRLFLAALLLMASFATALAYGWGGVLAVKHVLDVGTVVALVSYLARLYAPLLGLSNIQVSLMTALVSFERVFEVLDLPPMIQEKPGAVAIPEGPARIAFNQVAFRYPSAAEVSLASLESIAVPDKRPQASVLKGVTFTAEPGQLVALVGPSGAGKTTITHLIPRLYDVQSGAITINGLDVRDAKLDSLHQRIGVVTQDAHLFHDTIRANLLYARPDATDEQIKAALRDAQILSVVESLPEGLDTLVGERGYRFSGGEKQRLAIARLLLKAPDIVILDEATAHLDSESEAAIQQALEGALAGRTSIVIAHRLSTILKADQILVVQNGTIVQRGTHSELLAQSGIYAELYQRQLSTAADAPA
ncbi:MAG TPA: ABC transporter ATP-binding protein [Candidatus Acidoferrales bacterium]|jgi:ATP-binding cassette subfamily B protein|nr:ABC transporter ATP-binding protein [Candidatus Acidoferrales bacterium]